MKSVAIAFVLPCLFVFLAKINPAKGQQHDAGSLVAETSI